MVPTSRYWRTLPGSTSACGWNIRNKSSTPTLAVIRTNNGSVDSSIAQSGIVDVSTRRSLIHQYSCIGFKKNIPSGNVPSQFWEPAVLKTLISLFPYSNNPICLWITRNFWELSCWLEVSFHVASLKTTMSSTGTPITLLLYWGRHRWQHEAVDRGLDWCRENHKQT